MIGAWLTRPVSWRHAGLRRLVPSRIAAVFVRRHIANLAVAGPASTGADTPLDVFLRCAPRDLSIAPMALSSLHQHLTNHIVDTVVVTPESHTGLARTLFPNARVMADEDVLPSEIRRDIAAAVLPERTSWVTQQFLTLVHVSSQERPCLVWDADTIMVRPQTALAGRVAALAISAEHHRPYFTLIRALLPGVPLPVWSSTVAHHMLMEPELLRELFAEIEQATGDRPWWRAVLSRLVPREASPVADYELYGQWIRARHPDRVRLVGFRNIGLARSLFSAGAWRQESERQVVDSISSHWWIPEPDA